MSQRGQILHDERVFGETEQDPSPQAELVKEAFQTGAIALVLVLLCFVAGLAYGWTVQHPSTVCMVKQVFGFCKG